MNIIQDFFSGLMAGAPDVVAAIVLLIIAFIVAGIVKRIVVKALKKMNMDKYTDKLGMEEESAGGSLAIIGKLVYLIVFLLFLPGILAKLGMQNAATPITLLLSSLLGYIPNIIAAVIIFVIGLFIARIIKQILVPILRRLKVDRLQEKAGIEVEESGRLSSILANVVYILILLTVIIAALQALSIEAISVPAISMLNSIFAFIPNIIVATIMIIIGVVIAGIVATLITSILEGVGFDTYLNKTIAKERAGQKEIKGAKTVGSIVKVIIILFFAVEALNIIDLAVLQSVGQSVIAYLPLLISAIIIMSLAYLLATWVAGVLRKRGAKGSIMPIVAKVVILGLGIIMTLSQLNIATAIVNTGFIILMGAIGIAFAIAFGIGGKEYAANTMKKLEDKKEE
ncbi:hypothetical protein SANA_14270 [Gottschalkiaceae bacterium SANA]|nr:hypothetical protein SANA_14270 [Gottschalkiaceae bacterium SANA]